MQKRIIFGLLILVLLINTGGCNSTQTEAPEVKIEHTATKPLEKFDEATGIEVKTNSSSGKENTNIQKNMEDLEMKHWKYNRDLQAAREASQQIQQSQSDIDPAGQNSSSDINASKNIGQGNYSSGTGSYTPTKIYFITEDDFKKAVNQLIKLGYLNENSSNETSFKAALSQFQKDQELKSSGQLDAETIERLAAKTK